MVVGRQNLGIVTFSKFSNANPLAPIELGTVTTTGNTTLYDVGYLPDESEGFVGGNAVGAQFHVYNTAGAAPVFAASIDLGAGTILHRFEYEPVSSILYAASTSDTEELMLFKKN